MKRLLWIVVAISTLLIGSERVFVRQAVNAQPVLEESTLEIALKSVLTRQISVSAAELVRLVREGLASPEWKLRALALSTVAARGAATMLQGIGASPVVWEAERGQLNALRPSMEKALDDENQDVRLQAVAALQAVDFDGHGEPWKRLRGDTVAALIRRYEREPSSSVRFAIVDVIRGTAQRDSEAHKLLLTATRDQSPGVRDLSLVGLMELGPDIGLPMIIIALDDRDANVRRQASALVVSAGTAARSYLPQLEAALRRIQGDDQTRALLTQAINGLRGGATH